MAMIGIVPEVFKEDNYEFWKECLKSYLVGQGLYWDVVKGSDDTQKKKEEELAQNSQEWEKKNAKALHAIQLACGSHAYHKYKKSNGDHVSAKTAWEHLVELGHKVTHDQDKSSEVPVIVSDEIQRDNCLHTELENAVIGGHVENVKKILEKDNNAGKAIISSHGNTALHVAVLEGKMEVALELVNLMPPEGLQIINKFDATPLSLAVITDNLKLVKKMVEKNPNIPIIKGNTDESALPVIVASMYGRKKIVDYLYPRTPENLLDPEKGSDGVLLLNNLINANLFDTASKLLKRFPKLGITDYHGEYAIQKLAHKSSAFASGSKFPFRKRWIYHYVRIHSPWDDESQKGTETGSNAAEHRIDIPTEEKLTSRRKLLHRLGWIVLQLLVPGIKKMHDIKLVNDEARNLLSHIFMEIKNMKEEELQIVDKSVHIAIKHGIVEFVEELLKYSPEFIWRKDKRGRTIFSYAIIFRQEKIFSLFYGLGTKKSIVASRHDIFENNFLHLAAKLSPPAQLERVSGAALQMQRELQWYKEVEKIVQPKYKDQVNENNRKPHTLFTDEHKELAKEGEKWMKNTAGSSMIVGSLIAAVMFTTAFTIPGGTDSKSGLPIMLDTDKEAFLIFMVSNGLSLFSSSTSVLMFLGILTARYAEEDFYISLPTKLIFGISSLFFSIVTMMVSFGAALYLMLHKTLSWVSIPIIILSTFPILLFSALQFPILIEMFYRTYRRNKIFDKNKKIPSLSNITRS